MERVSPSNHHITIATYSSITGRPPEVCTFTFRARAGVISHVATTIKTVPAASSVADIAATCRRRGKDEEEIKRENARGQTFYIFVLISRTLDCLKDRITAVGKRQIGVFLSQHVS